MDLAARWEISDSVIAKVFLPMSPKDKKEPAA